MTITNEDVKNALNYVKKRKEKYFVACIDNLWEVLLMPALFHDDTYQHKLAAQSMVGLINWTIAELENKGNVASANALDAFYRQKKSYVQCAIILNRKNDRSVASALSDARKQTLRLWQTYGKHNDWPQLHHFIYEQRYLSLADNQRLILRILTVFADPQPKILLADLYQHAPKSGDSFQTTALKDNDLIPLQEANLIVLTEADTVAIHPEFRHFVHQKLTLIEKVRLHKQTEKRFLETGKYHHVIYHLTQRDAHKEAINTLVLYWREILQTQEISVLDKLITPLKALNLPPHLDSQLKYISGYVVHQANKLAEAKQLYKSAKDVVSSPKTIAEELALAQAYLGLAKVSQEIDKTRQVMGYLERCFSYLAGSMVEKNSRQIWIEAMLFKSHVVAEVQGNTEAAKEILAEISPIIDGLDTHERNAYQSDYHTRFAKVLSPRPFTNDEALRQNILWHREQAILFAEEPHDPKRRCDAYFNLADTLVQTNDFEAAEKYFIDTLEQARQKGYERIIALCYKGLGTVQFKQAQYEKASDFYLDAYRLFAQEKTDYRIAAVCFDLMETYQKLCNLESTRRFWQEAYQIAQDNQLKQLKEVLEGLAKGCPLMNTELSDREQMICQKIWLQKKANRREVANWLNLGVETASKALKKLDEKGVVKKEGWYYFMVCDE